VSNVPTARRASANDVSRATENSTADSTSSGSYIIALRAPLEIATKNTALQVRVGPPPPPNARPVRVRWPLAGFFPPFNRSGYAAAAAIITGQTDRRTDGRTPDDTFRFPVGRGRRNIARGLDCSCAMSATQA